MAIVMVPYMGIGHVMPMLVLARQLAMLGLKVLFVFPGKQYKLKALGGRDDSTPNITYEVVEMEDYIDTLTCDGLRQHQTTLEEYADIFDKVYEVLGIIRRRLDELLMLAPADALVLDPFLFYRGIVVDKLENVNKIFAFSPFSATSVFCFRHLMLNGFQPPFISAPELSFHLSEHDFPSSIVPGNGHPRADMHADRNKWMDATCAGLILNTWEDIERGPVSALASTLPAHFGVYSVGPLFSNGGEHDVSDDVLRFKCWLDKQDASSVLLVCLGSWIRITDDQMEELAMGLESSGVPFLWVIRDAEAASEFPWLEGFVERTKERALVHLGWAPQRFILGHEAVGGFLMTSGWNSVIEGLLLSPEGVAFIAWPLFLDHLPTCRLLVDGLGIAVEVKTSNTSSPYYGPVKRQDVCAAARSAMLGHKAREMRDRAKALGKAASLTVTTPQLQMLAEDMHSVVGKAKQDC